MVDASRSLVAWRELAAAMPDCAAVQVDGEFAYVSEDLASTLGATADDLTGESWRLPFGESAVGRLERGLALAKAEGEWTGAIAMEGANAGDSGEQPADERANEPADERANESTDERASDPVLELTLSAMEGEIFAWTVDDREHGSADPNRSSGGAKPSLVAHPSFVREVLDVVDDVVYVIDEDGQTHLWNEALVETTGYSHEELAGMHPSKLIPTDQHEYVPGLMDAIDAIEDRRVEVDILTKDGERITHEFRGTTFEDPRTGECFRCGVARDVTDRKERERALERQRDELATLDRINELLLETVRELVGTASREAVERAVCERLAESELYQFAWIGEREFGGDRVVARTTAGEDRGYLDAVTITADGRKTGDGPAGRALRTGEVQVADVDNPAFEPWRAAASERGFESVAAVPLHHGGTVYGVLAVYATRRDAFSEREQAGFDVLGRTVGSVIHAARSRELLFADAVVELEFRIVGPEATFTRIAAETDCSLSLDGYVPSGETWVLYLAVEGASPDDVISAASDDARIERARVVSEGDDGGRVELIVAESSLLHTVTAAGATLRSARADADGTELLVEAPVDADVRGFVKQVQEAYPGAELVAHRKRDHEVTTVGRPGGLLDELTDRQREVLEAAYRTGYFAWPRESTGEEVAASLDLSPPTLHGHLRKAEQTLLSELFDGGTPEQ